MATGVLVDANVLLSKTLRDWLFLLRNETEGGMFTVYATEDILAETLYHLRRNHPRAPGHMTSHVHDLVCEQLDDRVSDYTVDDSYPGLDPNDAHVHAAAVASGAGKLLTADSGFTKLPDDVAARLPYEVHTPDSFFTLIDDSAPLKVRAVTEKQMLYFLKRDGEADLPGRLKKSGCPTFAERIRLHLQALS